MEMLYYSRKLRKLRDVNSEIMNLGLILNKQTFQIRTRDRISSLKLFQGKTEPKPLFSHGIGNRVTRAWKIGFLRFKMYNLAFEDLKSSIINLYFEFGVILS